MLLVIRCSPILRRLMPLSRSLAASRIAFTLSDIVFLLRISATVPAYQRLPRGGAIFSMLRVRPISRSDKPVERNSLIRSNAFLWVAYVVRAV